MNSRKNAILAGALILVAYSMLGSGNPDQKLMGMLLEAISGAAVIGISLIMYPLFKPYNEQVSRWYLVFRVIEGLLMVITGALFLSSSTQLLAIRDLIWKGHSFVFIAGAFTFNYLLYISRIIPRWLSGYGIIATILLTIGNLLEITNLMPPIMILYLPIISNEVILAGWLIVKGFSLDQTSVTSSIEE